MQDGGDDSVEIITLKIGLYETCFGNLKGLFSQEYYLDYFNLTVLHVHHGQQ